MHWALIAQTMIAAPPEPRKHISWPAIAQFVAIFSGAAAFVTFLATVPFSPARYWAWRLRQQTDTVKGLDPDRHKAQRDVLMRPVDDLANRAAASQRIPTPWGRYIFLVTFWAVGVAQFITVFFFPGLLRLIDSWFGADSQGGFSPSSNDAFDNAYDGTTAVLTPSLTRSLTLISTALLFVCIAVAMPYIFVRLQLYNRRERRRFIDEGCRADFVLTPRPRTWIGRWLEAKPWSVDVPGDHRDVHPGRVRGE